MSSFYYRTESINKDNLESLFVEGSIERDVINNFKSPSHIVLEGSRGTGKSFLMKIAQKELDDNFKIDFVLPVYITFMESALLHSSHNNQFYYWMLAKVIRELRKVLNKNMISITSYSNNLLGGISEDKLSIIISLFESTYKNPTAKIDASLLPELSDVIDAIEDICDESCIARIVFFFDEAAHVFRPEQQRQFFSLFRDFKSPYISCNAAVYPGVTHYGNSFEMIHDAIGLKIERDILSPSYLEDMKSMVLKQGGEHWVKQIEQNLDLFNTLAMCASGNPRILLKTLDRCESLKQTKVNEVIRNFYRSEIWHEHTKLGEKYKGHKKIIDWGRSFIEDIVIPVTSKKNDERLLRDYKESTLYFWVSKDAPEQVKESLRLLCYTGIIRKYDNGVKATKSAIGYRYEIQFGCLLSSQQSPVSLSRELIDNVKLDFFTEYGANNQVFSSLKLDDIKEFSEEEFLESLNVQLNKKIDWLDITSWQKLKLHSINLITVKQLLEVDEGFLIRNLHGIGPVKARTIKNSATAELLESISG